MLEIFGLVLVVVGFVVLTKKVQFKHVRGLNDFDSSLATATIKHWALKNSLIAALD
jgi:hypothetical protein